MAATRFRGSLVHFSRWREMIRKEQREGKRSDSAGGGWRPREIRRREPSISGCCESATSTGAPGTPPTSIEALWVLMRARGKGGRRRVLSWASSSEGHTRGCSRAGNKSQGDEGPLRLGSPDTRTTAIEGRYMENDIHSTTGCTLHNQALLLQQANRSRI